MFFLQNKSNYITNLFLTRIISCSAILENNYYSILGLTPAATQNDIKKAYLELCKKHHPDKNKGSVESANKFRIIQEAYEILGNEKARKDYDKRIFQRFGHVETHRSKMKQDENYSYEAEKIFYQSRAAQKRYMGKTWYFDFEMWNECHYPNFKKKKAYQRSWSTIEIDFNADEKKKKSNVIHKLLLTTLIFVCSFVLIMPLFIPPSHNRFKVLKKESGKSEVNNDTSTSQ